MSASTNAQTATAAEETQSRPVLGRLFAGSIWSVVAAMASRFSTLAAMIVAARFLDRESYGMLGMIHATVYMSGLFAGSGVSVATMKLVAEYRTDRKSEAGHVIASSIMFTLMTTLVFGVALFVATPWIATSLLGKPALVGPMRIGPILLMLTAINVTQNGVLVGFEAFRVSAAANLICGLATLPILFLAAATGSLHVLVWAFVLAMALNCTFFHFAIVRSARKLEIPLRLRQSGRINPALLRLAVPAVMFWMMIAPTDWICSVILAKSSFGFAGLAIYVAANQWFGVFRFIAQNLSLALLPILAHATATGASSSTSRSILTQGLRLNLLIVIPFVLLGMAISPWLMRLYGTEYTSQWPTLMILMANAGVVAFLFPILRALHASGHMWLTFFLNVLWSVIFIGSTFLLVGHGSLGVAWARLIAYSVFAIITALVTVRIYRDDSATTVRARPDQEANQLRRAA